MDSVCACLAMHGSAREADLVRGPACDGMVLMSPSASKIHHHFVMGSGCACLARHGSARETDPLRGPACDANPLEMGSAHALPAYPSGAREADTVRGPARDGICACLAMRDSAREADLVRGPACDVSPLEMGMVGALGRRREKPT